MWRLNNISILIIVLKTSETYLCNNLFLIDSGVVVVLAGGVKGGGGSKGGVGVGGGVGGGDGGARRKTTDSKTKRELTKGNRI